LASDLKYYLDYSRWIDDENRTETWDESVDRVMDMHKTKYSKYLSNPRFMELFNEATSAYKNKLVLGSQRALQFGGDPILKHETKMYNCVGGYLDKISAFQEVMFFLLNGCGLGFSVQKRHIDKLPNIGKRIKGVKTFIVPDSIEGWSDAFGILISSYVSDEGESSFPEYEGYEIRFDLSLIRPEGAMISGGFKAPGPEGLRKSLLKCEELLEKLINNGGFRIKSITAYDFVMHMADAVLSGGVRRSATICFFSYDDDEMMNAKIGNWYYDNPQRARSNNSVVLKRDEISDSDFNNVFSKIKEYGEPGFLFVSDYDEVSNPCVEIRFFPMLEDGRTGWQGCNLTEGNGSACNTEEKFYEACRSLSILGTLQAGYTNFKYVNKTTRELFEREALLGCSFTGWMSNPHIMMNPDIQRKGAEIIKEVNRELASIIEINPASRATTCKPSGNSCTTFDTKIKTELGDMTLNEVFNYCMGEEIIIDNLIYDTFAKPKNLLKVFDENNELQDITALYMNGNTPVYDIEFEDGSIYKFTGNHKLKTINGWKKVDELLDGDEIISY
jgi:ribonucleoside-diphosphate reductase alpha chain